MTTTPRKKRSTPETAPLYKVIVDGSSCHGGALTWSLPHNGEPGDWQTVPPPIRLCERGLHLTREPVQWMAPSATVYLAEGEGESATDGGDKIAYERVRLLRELTASELAALQIYRGGAHAVRAGKAWASGSATVEAWDSATVEARDSATVEARDSATVEARDSATVEARDSATVEARDSATVRARGSATVLVRGSATVEAWDSATVEAWDSATVRARDSATVRARGSATVRARDSATVRAWDSATVRARGSATVISTPYHSPNAEVALARLAAHVDRRGCGLMLRQAEDAPSAGPPRTEGAG